MKKKHEVQQNGKEKQAFEGSQDEESKLMMSGK